MHLPTGLPLPGLTFPTFRRHSTLGFVTERRTSLVVVYPRPEHLTNAPINHVLSYTEGEPTPSERRNRHQEKIMKFWAIFSQSMSCTENGVFHYRSKG